VGCSVFLSLVDSSCVYTTTHCPTLLAFALALAHPRPPPPRTRPRPRPRLCLCPPSPEPVHASVRTEPPVCHRLLPVSALSPRAVRFSPRFDSPRLAVLRHDCSSSSPFPEMGLRRSRFYRRRTRPCRGVRPTPLFFSFSMFFSPLFSNEFSQIEARC